MWDSNPRPHDFVPAEKKTLNVFNDTMWQQFIIIKNKILLIQSSRDNTTNVVGLPSPDILPHKRQKVARVVLTLVISTRMITLLYKGYTKNVRVPHPEFPPHKSYMQQVSFFYNLT